MNKKFSRTEFKDITATDLTRGKAPAMLRDIEDTKATYLVNKNSKPCAVVISYKEYKRLIEQNKGE